MPSGATIDLGRSLPDMAYYSDDTDCNDCRKTVHGNELGHVAI